MCGIAGFIINGRQINKNEAGRILFKMCKSIQYRGPDDYGTYLYGFDVSSSSGPGVGFGHNRLSIIDLSSAGHQPMTNEDSSVWLTYNGEIYNFLELREYLLSKGHLFRSRTDTEVIIHGYEEWGDECISRFNGMFAFALWDAKEKKLLLVRDRMGKKPLYYTYMNGGIIFASEPKAILQFPDFRREIDDGALKKYFLFEYVPSPHTIYKNIERIQAGNLLIWQDENISIKKYWDISFGPCDISASDRDDVKQLRGLLKDSVEKRLMSDVPLGVFLSGGLDSSSVVSLMTEIMPRKNVRTFTIGFEDKSFDESKYARETADYLGTEHHEKILDPGTMLSMIPEIVNFLDEPFADASIIPTYLLSKYTREFVTVALSGDGGDELFAGYDTFPAHRLARIYEKIPRLIKKYLIEGAIKRLPVSLDNLSLDFKLKQFLKGIPYKLEARNQIWLGSFSPQEQALLLTGDRQRESSGVCVFEDIDLSLKNCKARHYIELILYLYCKFYLQDDILTKVDRASMACSLEVRAPFLDYRFVELACSLPVHEKIRGFTTKYILKKMMKNSLPMAVTKRAKKGFGIPVAKWIRDDLKGMVTDELSFDKIKKEGILNPAYVHELLDGHLKGEKDNRKQLWTILMFELWYEKWLKGSL